MSGGNLMVNYKNIISSGIALFLLLNIACNIFGLISDNLYYRALLIIQIILAFMAYVLLNGHIKGNNTQWKIICFVITIQALAYYFNFLMEDYYLLDLHRLLAFACMLWILWVIPHYTYIDIKFFCRLLNFILMVGFFACIYNLVINWGIIKSFDIKIIMNYTTKFKSFFNSRSNFCLLLCIDSVICLYLHEKNKFKLVYIFYYLFFFGNIVLTNARTSIIVMVCITGFYMVQNKTRKIYAILFSTGLLLVLPWGQIFTEVVNFKTKYNLLFERNTGADLSNGRFELWRNAWRGTNGVSFFIGHGIGSKDTYLSYINSSVLSFHNMWVDLFFEGGLIIVCLYINIIRDVVTRVKKSVLKSPEKHLFYNFFLVLILVGMGDAIGTLFFLDTFSIVTTLLFITCPLCLINAVKCNK